MKGFVYVMSNKAMPDLVKIGFSTKHPELRAKELEGTGLPYAYIVEYCAFLENPFEVEQATHQRLADKNEAKEFFRVGIEEAVFSLLDTTKEMGVVVLYEEDVFGLKKRAQEEAEKAKQEAEKTKRKAEKAKRKEKFSIALRTVATKWRLTASDLKELSAIQLSLEIDEHERDNIERELFGESLANHFARERQARLDKEIAQEGLRLEIEKKRQLIRSTRPLTDPGADIADVVICPVCLGSVATNGKPSPYSCTTCGKRFSIKE